MVDVIKVVGPIFIYGVSTRHIISMCPNERRDRVSVEDIAIMSVAPCQRRVR
jgi:hypothetical protein